MLNFRNLLLALTLACCGNAVAEDRDVYRWVDADGKAHYSDRPQADEAQRLDITSRSTDNARINQARQARIEEKQTRQTALAENAKTQESAEAEAERVAENCRRARTALASIVNARRLYEPTDDGGRRYLEAAEIAQRRGKAEADVAQWCN